MTDDPQTRPTPPEGGWAPPAAAAPVRAEGQEAPVPPVPPAPARYVTAPGAVTRAGTPGSVPGPAPAPGSAPWPAAGAGAGAWGGSEPAPGTWGAPPAPARPRWVVPVVVASCLALLVGVAGFGVGALALWSTATGDVVAEDDVWYVDDPYGEYTGTVDWIGTDSVAGLDVGTCFSVDDADLDGSGTTEVAASCDEVHTGEVYATTTVPGDGWPGGQAVADTASTACEDSFEDFVGLDWWSSAVEYGAVGPTETTWQGGDHEVRCFAFVRTTERVGSLEGSRE